MNTLPKELISSHKIKFSDRISLQPGGVNLSYFKIGLFYLPGQIGSCGWSLVSKKLVRF